MYHNIDDPQKPEIMLTEVGLRDGLQSEARYIPVDVKVSIARSLIAAGVRSFELSSFVSPRAVPQLAMRPIFLRLWRRSATLSSPPWWPMSRGWKERSRQASSRS